MILMYKRDRSSAATKRRKGRVEKNKMLLWIMFGCIFNSIISILIHEGWVDDYRGDDSVVFGLGHGLEYKQTLLLQEITPNHSIPAIKPFAPCPKEFCKLVWYKHQPSHKLYEPVYRAFHSRGYSRAKDLTRAHFLWSDQPNLASDFYQALEPWQRYNFFPNTNQWDDKDKMAETMNQYYSDRGIQPLHSFPESYVLHHANGLEAFSKRLENGGMDLPWVLKQPTVNQGKGLIVLPSQSDELKGIIDRIEEEVLPKGLEGGNKGRLVVQRYICDEMTYGGRKFDVRVYWAVASVDPLLVFFHTKQNYARIGHALYDESKLGNSTTKDHLTTHTFGATETKATWDEFRELIENHVFGSESKFLDRFSRDNRNENSTLETIEAILSDPFLHVQNQMKTIIGHLANAYQNITFHGRDMVTENGFSWHAADMIIDNNLDVYIIEGTDGPGKDEDYDFRIKMHDELLGSLVDIVEEVTSRQEEGRPLDVSEMMKKGVLGGYDVVYNDGWFMNYRYHRLPNKGCLGVSSTRMNSDSETKAFLPTRTVVPANFTALPKRPRSNGENMTFWMKSRTSRSNEPVARSLRHNGWTPVSTPEDAQLIYHTDKYEDTTQPWQWLSQFPSQFSFFEGDHLLYLDNTEGNVCRPIQHGKRPLEIIVYWLVLSLDPLIVLYHDGFLYFPSSTIDENEFLDLPKLGGKTEKIWKGSWKALAHCLNTEYAKMVSSGESEAAVAAAAISLDPFSHVRNQMKASVVKIANGFSKHALEKPLVEKQKYSSYALFYAQFQVDQNLNVFANGAYHSYLKAEDHTEVVSLHNELYGSAFRLLKYLNNTSSEKSSRETRSDAEILGKYEWLIRPDISNPKTKSWTFRYDWKYKAKECSE